MRGRISSRTIIVFLVFAFFTSCEEEPKFDVQVLQGRWELVKGLRNQKETKTLSGTYFLFEKEKMITNLPVGPEELIAYTLDENIIRQKNTPPVEYAIQVLTDSSLVLGLELRGMQFEMHFQRAVDSSPSDSFDTWPADQNAPPATQGDSLSQN